MTKTEPGNLPPRIVRPPPGPRSRRLSARLAATESRNVTFLSPDFPIFWRRARGSNVWDADGNRYVDLSAGFGVAAAGHRSRRVVAALRAQAGRLPHGMGDVHPPEIKVRLLERLASIAPVPDPRIVLATSGAEAVEIALKTARLATGRPGVLAFRGAYHGLTYGALSVTDRALFREPFADQLNPHVVRVDFPNPFRVPDGADRDALAREAAAAVAAALDDPAAPPVGAVIVEPIQGRGGEIVPPRGFLPALAVLCRDRGALLIADEIFTGLGRTGRLFACEEEGIVPDLLCVGKSLSGALPLSACIGTSRLMDAWPTSEGEAKHTSTFLGNPLACAAALASLTEIQRLDLAGRARIEGERWLRELTRMAAGHPGVAEVRGRGLMIGVEIVRAEGGRERPDGPRTGRILVEALRRGWIVLAGGAASNVVSLTPPLTISSSLLAASVDILDEVLAATAS
ncbi:MAG: aspartate aminotransferase family protein [Gemmatimonadota bacterium]